ncbi:MAG TPA: ISKra4 family transposase, partial [Isosphaeraceae bacterium]|nr:ISKra4 family transposase [Isosphaeraceae bacterium]
MCGGGPPFGAAVAWAGPADAQGRPTAYVSIDATGIGMQGPGGVAAEGRMVWVGTVSAPRTEPDDSLPNRPAAVERARYLAGSMDRDGLGAQLRRQAAQVGRDRAERGVALTDGGSGLEDFMRVHFPRAERILGFDHAAEHLAELAQAVHGGAAEAAEVQAEGWAHQMRHEGGGAI